jgi:hypothetical protein
MNHDARSSECQRCDSRCMCSAVGTVTRLWSRRSGASNPGFGKKFFLFQNGQTGSRAHTASCLMGTERSSPGGKAAGAWDWSRPMYAFISSTRTTCIHFYCTDSGINFVKRFKAAGNGHRWTREVSRNTLRKYANFMSHKYVNSYSKLKKWDISAISQISKELHAYLLNVLNHIR